MARLTRRQWLGLAFGGALLASTAGMMTAAPAQAYEDRFVLQCTDITPSTKTTNYPGKDKIILSNNLVRPTGKADDAPGQVLTLTGRLTDENCVPITNAIVDIWQANPFGEYRWASSQELLTPEPIFAGNGRTVTDNLGRFNFTTLFPGGTGKSAPHIFVKVTHPDFDSLDTTVYFRGDRRNSSDPRFQALSSKAQSLLLGDVMLNNPSAPQAGLSVTFNITLKGNSDYRGF